MKKKLLNSLERRKQIIENKSLATIGREKFSAFNQNLITKNNEYTPNAMKNSLKLKEKKNLISSRKNYNEKDFFLNKRTINEFPNYKTLSHQLVKGTIFFNKIMSADRKGHLLRILDSFDREHIEIGNNIPLDMHLRKYFLKFKFVTSSDREFISDQVYNLIRYKGLIDFIAKPPLNWFSRFDTYYDSSFEIQKNNVNIPA